MVCTCCGAARTPIRASAAYCGVAEGDPGPRGPGGTSPAVDHHRDPEPEITAGLTENVGKALAKLVPAQPSHEAESSIVIE